MPLRRNGDAVAPERGGGCAGTATRLSDADAESKLRGSAKASLTFCRRLRTRRLADPRGQLITGGRGLPPLPRGLPNRRWRLGRQCGRGLVAAYHGGCLTDGGVPNPGRGGRPLPPRTRPRGGLLKRPFACTRGVEPAEPRAKRWRSPLSPVGVYSLLGTRPRMGWARGVWPCRGGVPRRISRDGRVVCPRQLQETKVSRARDLGLSSASW